MEKLDLLIEIEILLGALTLGFLFAKLFEEGWNLMDCFKSFIIYRITMKENKLHEPDNSYFKQVNKVRLMNGKKAFTFEEYETHFVDGHWYGD